MNSVYFSPSTQENNIGLGEYGSEEKVMNAVCDVAEKEIIRHGIISYRNDPKMNVMQTAIDSNNKRPNLFVAIHSNANDGKSRGCEVFCHVLGGEGEKFAKILYKELASITPTSDRGIKTGKNYYGTWKHMYELAYTDAPAVLAEVDFHDNSESAKWILDNIETIGLTIARSILQYFNIAYISQVEEVLKPINPDEWKLQKVRDSFTANLISDCDEWMRKINEPMPVWAVLTIALNLKRYVDQTFKQK